MLRLPITSISLILRVVREFMNVVRWRASLGGFVSASSSSRMALSVVFSWCDHMKTVSRLPNTARSCLTNA